MVKNIEGKISPAVEELLDSAAADQPIEVIVQMEPPRIPTRGSRAERIEAAKKTFDQDLQILQESVAETGGTVLESAWINSTARFRATPDQIRRLESNSVVLGIDSPVTIEPD